MKKKLFFLPFVAALALTGCSDDEPVVDGSEAGAGGEGTRYLAVNIVSTDNVGSRAETESIRDNGTNQYPEGGMIFEDGTTAENEVNSLRIYFFNSVGNPAYVKDNKINYYDVPKEEIIREGGRVPGETVESSLKAIVVVNAGEYLPTKMVAIVNPIIEGANGLGRESFTLDVLQRRVYDYGTLANKGTFVMSNSVYSDGGQIVRSSTILPENFKTKPEDALNKPVIMYVERNAAKVRVRASIADKQNNPKGAGIMVPVLTKVEGEGGAITEERLTIQRPVIENGEPKEDADGHITTQSVAVWVKLLAWDVTADLKMGYLLKSINPVTWKNQIAGKFAWNYPGYHRSIWAAICYGGGEPFVPNVNRYFSYDGSQAPEYNGLASDYTFFGNDKFDGIEAVYCNENAERNETDNPVTFETTKVIIKAEICDSEGNPLTLSEYGGTLNVDDATFRSLKSRYLSLLSNSRAHSHYKVTVNDDGTKVARQISFEDIDFITSSQVPAESKETAAPADEGKAATSGMGNYYVYACLADGAVPTEGGNFKWYSELGDVTTDAEGTITSFTVDESKVLTATEINQHLYTLSHAKIWNEGRAYYYANIIHDPTSNHAGVVRNHIYELDLTKVLGLGTPVYDPTEVIIPEKPQNDDTFIAAQIKILSWRFVTQSVTLDWETPGE